MGPSWLFHSTTCCFINLFLSLERSCLCQNAFLGNGLNCSDDTDLDYYPDFPVVIGTNLELDNCPLTYNPAQEDCDNDGVGDACTSYLDFDPGMVTLMNRSIVIEPGTRNFSLNLTLPENSSYTVGVEFCEVGWIECEQFYSLSNFSSSGSGEIAVYLDSEHSEWSLNYILLSIYQQGNETSRVRLLVISQNLTVPEFQSRSFVSGDRVWVGVSVSSCTSECPYLNSSLWSVGLRDINLDGMTDYFSLELDYCEFLPSVHWFGFSSYVYSILVKQATDLMNGRYRVNVTGDNIRGYSTFQLLYLGLPNACEARLDIGLYWNWTSVGATASISCADLFGNLTQDANSTGSRNDLTRYCGEEAEWERISGQCVFDGSVVKVG